MAEIKNYTLNFGSGPAARGAALTCPAGKLAFTEIALSSIGGMAARSRLDY
jgi:hypothetical protein